ncbi:MAG: glycoside hydrolase [Firmicutes bacterium]|nr:glycoside hydrolase [Bacillota bacterium]
MLRRCHSPLAWLGLLAALCATGACRNSVPAPAAHFETQPRSLPVGSTAGSVRWPKVGVTASGTLYLLALESTPAGERLALRISHDHGDTFGPPIWVSPAGASLSAHGENSPALAWSPTTLYALWEQRRADGFTDILVARSVDFGRSFQQPLSVVRKAQPSFHGFANLAVAPDGDVYVAWLDARDEPEGSGTFSVYVSRLSHRGASFSENIRVAGSACPCCRVALLAAAGGRVWIAWRKVFEGDVRDIVVSASHDGGRTFAPPVRVAADNWRIAGCPHSGPTISAHDQRLFVAWMTEAQGRSVVRLAWSDDHGATFQPPLTVSGDILDANHPTFSRSPDGRLLLSFEGRPDEGPSWQAVRPYVVELRPSGQPSAPLPVPSGERSAAYPAIAAGTAGRLFVAWTEPGHPESRALLCRGRLQD